MTEVAQGTSLARFGDGEFQIMAGENARYQQYEDALAAELRQILEHSTCLIGIPRSNLVGLTRDWGVFLEKYGRGLKPDKWYGSAFVSRADEVIWTKEYRRLLVGLWSERSIVFVAPEAIEFKGAKGTHRLKASFRNAFDNVDWLESEAIKYGRYEPVILSCGPTATVLADRLARKGIWAVDLGNFAKFL